MSGSKKLSKTVAIVLNEEIINEINFIKNNLYDPDLSFSAIVRKLLEKGMIEAKKEIEEKEAMKKVYQESLSKEEL